MRIIISYINSPWRSNCKMNKRRGNRCVFKNCLSISIQWRKKTLFRFPKDTKRLKLWIAACARNDLLSKTSTELYKNYRVCKLHFKKNMFLNYKQTRLQPHAIPNFIFKTNLEITDEAESIETQNIKDVIMEVNTTNLLEKDTTMQENINEILLNTETPMSSSIGNAKIPILSSIGINKH